MAQRGLQSWFVGMQRLAETMKGAVLILKHISPTWERTRGVNQFLP
jgi:hypothetical protein